MELKDLKEKLTKKKVSVWKKRSFYEVDKYCDGYKAFIDYSKTERLATKKAVEILEADGYKPLSYFIEKNELPEDSKVYYVNRDKTVLAIRVKGKISDGVNMIGSHIDAPRLDIKPEPIIEDYEIAMAKTHYYGGIKKYQWLNIPLALHGVIINAKGEKIEVSIGEDPADPIFMISDLLPHLDRREGDVRKVFDAEKLNILLGSMSISYDEEVKDGVKLNILKILNEKYGIIEEDFISAELEIVPAGKARDLGLDRSLIAAYGHDDRICAYTSLTALLEATPKTRSIAMLLADKEETGSDGNTGAKSMFWYYVLKELIRLQKGDVCIDIDRTIEKSTLLSADVAAAVDPNYKDVHDLANAPKLGYGIVITKYTGSGGKSSTNDANAELVGKIRKAFAENEIIWQTGELGKTDQGGGGTIAKFFSEKSMDVIDAGIALLGMHAPYEIASKADIYETHLAYKAFLENI